MISQGVPKKDSGLGNDDAVMAGLAGENLTQHGLEKFERFALVVGIESRHVPLLAKPRRAADIVFRRKRLAILVDGCFWHGCLKHGTSSKSNADFWRDKIETNKRRDLNTNKRLATAGWRVLRVWKHEDPEVGADRIVKALEFDA